MSAELVSQNGAVATKGLIEHDEVERALEESVAASSLATSFSQRPNVVRARSVFKISEENLPNHLTCSTLAGQGMISTRPVYFVDDDGGALLAFYHLGQRLSGHPKVVHGGLTAVILDECMGRASFSRFVRHVTVTAKLEISYQAPVHVDSVIVIHAEVTETQGRKAWVSATLKDAASGTVLVTASGLFIEPKWAADIIQE